MHGFRYLLRVRYAECDAQGIAFNSRWGDWIDLGTTELLRAVFGDPGAMDYRLVEQNTTWLRPAHFDDVVTVTPSVVKVGRTSFQVHTLCSVGGEERVHAVTTYVRVKDGVKCNIDEPLREALMRGALGRVTDHAMSGMGRVARVNRLADMTPVPWRNGGGVTRELWSEGEGPGGFGIRLSVAEVEEDGPFSVFPGVDRVIAQLSGAGFALSREGVSVEVSGHGPWAFAGEDVWQCRLLDGPVRDFNVMVDRAKWRAAVVPRSAGVLRGRFAVARSSGRIGGLPVDAGDLAVLTGEVWADGEVYEVSFTRV
jgi:acyl-CoA thioester hydrolase